MRVRRIGDGGYFRPTKLRRWPRMRQRFVRTRIMSLVRCLVLITINGLLVEVGKRGKGQGEGMNDAATISAADPDRREHLAQRPWLLRNGPRHSGVRLV